jgi:hypothetical protein
LISWTIGRSKGMTLFLVPLNDIICKLDAVRMLQNVISVHLTYKTIFTNIAFVNRVI